MLWIPKKGKLLRQTNAGSVGASTFGTTVTASGTASVKGTAAQLIASTNFDVYWVKIIAGGIGTSTVASAAALDILIGAATEEVLIPNLLAGYSANLLNGNIGPKCWEFPLYIAAGTRIAAQIASERVSAGCDVAIYLFGGDGLPPFRIGSKVTTYGMGTVPNGTAITPGASGAEGSWTEITSGTSEDHFAFMPSFQNSADTTTSNKQFSLDIGIGAATESEIGGPYVYETDANEHMSGPFCSMPAIQDVPSGTRLVMRASNSGTNDDAYNAAIHAVS